MFPNETDEFSHGYGSDFHGFHFMPFCSELQNNLMR